MFQQDYLAHNIRKYRLLHGLTQAQLAQKLFVTAQNISKWETGRSVPDLENLCMLSHILHISTDRLLGRTEALSRGRVMVAIDGGGTKTEFVLFTEQGEILERLCLHGSNPNSVGLDNAKLTLKSGIEQLMMVNGDICGIYAGIAGCGNASVQRSLLNYLQKLCPSIPCRVGSDILNVIYSAPVQDRCIAVICGTGSVVYAKTASQLVRIGGWGPLWESGFSGYDFGRDALLAALKARDGLSQPTALLNMVEKTLGGDVWEKINEIYKLPREEIGAYAKLVFDAYLRDDEIARQIIEKNANQLALLINTAAENYDCGIEVVIAGGMISQKDILQPHLQPKLLPGLKLHFNDMPQICGAAAKCCGTLGIETPAFKEIFYKNYLQIMEDDHNAQNGNA